LLDRLPADETLAEEEHHPARALSRVDVTGMVAVAIADDVCRAGTPRVVQAIVEGVRDVADDPLDGLPMLHHRSLHEPTDVADGECQVWPRVGEVAKAPHKAPVLRGIDLLRGAVAANVQPLLHRSERGVAISEPPSSTMRLALAVYRRLVPESS
jgi:hypothetical protein